MFNIGGRKKVEAGALCERKNGRGVDTNRNWDIHWGFQEKDYDPSEEYPGTAPFRCAPDAVPFALIEQAMQMLSSQYMNALCNGQSAELNCMKVWQISE